MPSPRRHLPWDWRHPSATVRRAACGLADPQRFTFEPSKVTCIACTRTLKMADAEALRAITGKQSSVLNRKGKP